MICDAALAFKCMTRPAPAYLLSLSGICGHETRNLQVFKITLFKTSTGQRTFYYQTASLWNSLERNLKLSKSLNAFKQRLQGKL